MNNDDENLISLGQCRIFVGSSSGFDDCESGDHQHDDRDVLPVPANEENDKR